MGLQVPMPEVLGREIDRQALSDDNCWLDYVIYEWLNIILHEARMKGLQELSWLNATGGDIALVLNQSINQSMRYFKLRLKSKQDQKQCDTWLLALHFLLA